MHDIKIRPETMQNRDKGRGKRKRKEARPGQWHAGRPRQWIGHYGTVNN